ncbi:hypothetical protein [Microbacterium maritypicum]|uniref:hypothetical protein n=1 Tax=Microbacterium maritypicum TaxID=33918 RepID=UPI003802E77E
MTPTVPSSRRSSLRPTVIGWVAWCLFILSVFVVSTNAGRDRYAGVCPGPGEGGRDWVFELFPFAQTCVVRGVFPPVTVAAMIQTVVVYVSLLVALVATVRLLTMGRFRELPRGAMLISAQAAGILLTGAMLLVQRDSALQPPGAGGVNVGLVWGAAVALGLATAVTVIVFVFVSLVNLGRAHSEARR